VFTATDIAVTDATAVEVYVGGILQTAGYTVSAINPVSVTFTTAPTENYQVTILVLRGKSWYTPGAGTASDGVPLQEQETLAARFIRGN
jgi:cyanate permease